MRRRIGLVTLTTAIVIAAALPAGASAESSDPPSCYGEFVSDAAQVVGLGAFVSGVATTSAPGAIAEGVRAFKAGCVS